MTERLKGWQMKSASGSFSSLLLLQPLKYHFSPKAPTLEREHYAPMRP